MKVELHQGTGLCYITTETPDDQYMLGKLSAKIKGSRVYSDGDGSRRMECDTKALLDAAVAAS